MILSRRFLMVGLTSTGFSFAALRAAAAAPAPAGAAISGAGLSGRRLGSSIEILSLDPLGPAARSGLRPGDRVVDWVGGDLLQLGQALNGAPESRLILTVMRGVRQRQVQLVLEGDNQTVRP